MGTPQYNMKKVMSIWMSQRIYPTLIIERNYHTNLTMVSFNEHENNSNEQVKRLIPVTYIRQKFSHYIQTAPALWLDKNVTILHDRYANHYKIDEDEWILLNVQQCGEYRSQMQKPFVCFRYIVLSDFLFPQQVIIA